MGRAAWPQAPGDRVGCCHGSQHRQSPCTLLPSALLGPLKDTVSVQCHPWPGRPLPGSALGTLRGCSVVAKGPVGPSHVPVTPCRAVPMDGWHLVAPAPGALGAAPGRAAALLAAWGWGALGTAPAAQRPPRWGRGGRQQGDPAPGLPARKGASPSLCGAGGAGAITQHFDFGFQLNLWLLLSRTLGRTRCRCCCPCARRCRDTHWWPRSSCPCWFWHCAPDPCCSHSFLVQQSR